MKLTLDIDRLAIPEVTPFTQAQLTAALEAELDRLVTSHGLPFGHEVGQIDVGRAAFTVEPGASAAETGVRIARQLFSGLHREAGGTIPADLRRDDR